MEKRYIRENRDTVEKRKMYTLSGEWELCMQDIEKGNINNIDLIFEKEGIKCNVPGDVHNAFTQAGIIEDPLIDLNSRKCRWMEEKEFWYRKVFYIENAFIKDYTEIVFEGLDLTADIWINNSYIGRHNNAFIEKVIDISKYIKSSENVLIVRIDGGINSVKNKPVDLMEKSWNNEQPYRAWMRKPQFVYGWDWTIWMPTCGIWRDVYINSYESAGIKEYNITTGFETDKISEAESVQLTVEADIRLLKNGRYCLRCEVYEDERYDNCDSYVVMADKVIDVTEPASILHNLELEINKPELWWSNGMGKPYLYNIKIILTDTDGNILQCVSKKHGLRSIRIEEKPLDKESKSFTFVLNDNPVFIKGANHVPSDCFIGNITNDKTKALIEAAAQANMNMLRVWGGGVYESEAFMDECDKSGIMVWHDFMFACAYYPDYDSEFYEEIHREASAAIKRLRKHTSLIGWSGNNEIQEMYLGAKKADTNFPWYGGKIYEELLPELVAELCPDRIYRESSPFGGDEPTSYQEGDQHTWHFTHRPNWEHYLDLWRFTDFDYKFLSEFGIIGAMNIESARKCISEQVLNTESDEWLHHTNSSSEHKLLDIIVKKYFDINNEISLQDYILKSQVIQAEIMRHVYDELRNRKFRCSGALLWTLSDSYGINNWSVIDYYLAKRPVYYYLKRSMSPINVSFRGYEVQNFDGMKNYHEYYKGKTKPIEILVVNDTLENREVLLEYKVVTFSGQELKTEKITKLVPANSVSNAISVELSDLQDNWEPESTLLHAQISAEGRLLNENRYFFAPYKNLKLEPANIKCSIHKISEACFEMKLLADAFVWMLHLAGTDNVKYSDNDFDLIPNMERSIMVECDDINTYNPEMYSLNGEIEMKVIIQD